MYRSIVAENHDPSLSSWFESNISSSYAEEFGAFAPFVSAAEQAQIVELDSLVEEVELEAAATITEVSAAELALGAATTLFPLAAIAGIGVAIYELWPRQRKQQDQPAPRQNQRSSAPSLNRDRKSVV